MSRYVKQHLLSTICASILLSLLVAAAVSAQSANTPPAPWTYQGDSGPEHWGELSDEYSLCSEGTSQSPVAIRDITNTATTDLTFDYKPSPLVVKHNGYSLQVDYAPGSSIEFDGVTYALKSFTFHSPGEHPVNRVLYSMEIELLHEDADGNLAIVSILGDTQVRRNELFRGLWRTLSRITSEPWEVGVPFNAADMLPEDRSYYTYTGSLTTPPCTEGVRWIVLQQPIKLANVQVQEFTDIFGTNARPVQPLNGREVTIGDAAG